MQSKIIFLLLFMLSFTVMHDTVINILDHTEKLSISEYAQQSNDISDVHDMHDIFHFIALISERCISLEPLKKENTFSAYLFQYTFSSLHHSTKPPIA